MSRIGKKKIWVNLPVLVPGVQEPTNPIRWDFSERGITVWTTDFLQHFCSWEDIDEYREALRLSKEALASTPQIPKCPACQRILEAGGVVPIARAITSPWMCGSCFGFVCKECRTPLYSGNSVEADGSLLCKSCKEARNGKP